MVANLMLSWGMLVGVIIGAFVAWFWHDSLGVRERANQAAMEACQQLQLQFLDGTVAFTRLWPARGYDGRMALRRTYVFDYTADSVARRQGFVVLLGQRVESVGFANDATHAGTAARSTEVVAPIATESRDNAFPVAGNVYDLKSWRDDPRRIRQPPQGNGNGET
jgi:Protein of unknown function (DUF3301)